jgi:hypothetical protein
MSKLPPQLPASVHVPSPPHLNLCCRVFEEMVSHGYPAADAVALESLIMGYARVGRMKDAMNHINELERRVSSPLLGPVCIE